MKTLTEITNIISNQFGRIAQTVDDEYNVIVCPERIFVEDYLPREEEYVAKNSELPSLDSDTPLDLPYRKTIFVVIKVGSGQRNMAVSSSSVSIQCLSEENDFVVARQMLDAFISFYNFEYIDGLIQSYFNPETSSSQDAVYTGFRSLLSLRGNVRIPEQRIAFIQDICISLDGEKWMKLPFINVSWQHNAQPDPQAFADGEGYTLALNRQSTQAISISTYMWATSNVNSIAEKYISLHEQELSEAKKDDIRSNPLEYAEDFSEGAPLSQDDLLSLFSALCIEHPNHMNKKFKMALRTNLLYDGAPVILNDRRMTIINDWFLLTSVNYSQQWGDISTWGLSFTRAREVN